MLFPDLLNTSEENVLIVTTGDRGDLLIGAWQANLSANYPKESGIVLTTDSEPDAPIMRLLSGRQPVLPILTVNLSTFGHWPLGQYSRALKNPSMT